MNRFNRNQSVLIIGGKLLGLTSAIEIKKRCPEAKISVIEKESFLTSDNHIIDKSATLSSTKTLHTGTYYTHRGHSRGKDPKEKELLMNLAKETSQDYIKMMQLLKEYHLTPKGKYAQTLYLMFQDAFVEPYYFENITKKRGLWIRKAPLKEFKRLKTIFSKYEGINGKPLKLEGAYYSKDSLIDLVTLLKKFEQKAKKMGIILIEKAKIIHVSNSSVTIESNGIEKIIKTDCIVNTTSAFTAQTDKILAAEPPPKNSYQLKYRHIGWVDKKAVSIFNEVSQSKLSYFRIFQGEYKVTFAEVIGNSDKVSFYAPKLIRIPNDKPDLPFSLDSKKDPSLLKVMEKWKIYPENNNFHAYIGLAAYTSDGKNIFHESKTKTGIPVMNSITEKMSGFISAAPYISEWVQNTLQKRIAVTLVGAGYYGVNLVSPKYQEMSQVIIKSVISPTISKKTLAQSALSGIPLYRSVAKWRENEKPTNIDIFDLSIHLDILPKIVQDLVRIGAKNFIFPKPIALTEKQLNSLIRIIKKYKLNIVIASQWYYSNLTKKIKQLLCKRKAQIRRIECNFSQNFDSIRIKKYTPTTALVPHILQILHSIGVISTNHLLTVIEYTPFNILFQIKNKNNLEILVKSDLSSDKQERSIKIFLDDGIISADFLGKIIKGKWIIYPSISYGNQTRQIVEDNLEVMLEKIINYFAAPGAKNKNDNLLTFDKYLPVSKIQIELEKKIVKFR